MHRTIVSATALFFQLASTAVLPTPSDFVVTALVSTPGSLGTTTIIEPVSLDLLRPNLEDATTTLSSTRTVELIRPTSKVVLSSSEDDLLELKTSAQGLPFNPLYPTGFAEALLPTTKNISDIYATETSIKSATAAITDALHKAFATSAGALQAPVKTVTIKDATTETITIHHTPMVTPPPAPITMDAGYMSSRSAVLSHIAAASAFLDTDDESYIESEWAFWHAQEAARTLRLMSQSSIASAAMAKDTGYVVATTTSTAFAEGIKTRPTLTTTMTISAMPTSVALHTRQASNSTSGGAAPNGPDASMMAWMAQLPPPLRGLFDDDNVGKLIIFHRGDLDIEYNTGLKARRSVSSNEERQSPDTHAKPPVFNDGKKTIIVDDGNVKVQINKWGPGPHQQTV